MSAKSYDMTGYTKLFGSIIASTIWRESKETKVVWITMLAMANKHGIVEASLPGLADMARCSVAETETAINVLLAPDSFSRTKDYEGRRIAPVDGGWTILNHAKYRAKMGLDERREYNRLKQQEFRAKDGQNRRKRGVSKRQTSSMTVNDSQQCQHIAEADTETKAIPPIPEGLKAAWDNWKTYRRERKLPAYVPSGEKVQVARLMEWGQSRAVAAINYSMAQNYQGICEEKGNGQHAPVQDKPRVYENMRQQPQLPLSTP